MNSFIINRKRTWVSALLVAGWLLGTPVTPARADPGAISEYAVKAAFVNNFVQFVEWPPSAFQDASAALIIGVLGNDPFGPLLEQTVKDETVKGRGIIIRRISKIDDAVSCHVLYISRSEKERLPLILKRLASLPIMTVGDMESFADLGGVVNFYLEKNRIRFEINQESARQNGLKISSKLLCLGRIVGSKSSKESH